MIHEKDYNSINDFNQTKPMKAVVNIAKSDPLSMDDGDVSLSFPVAKNVLFQNGIYVLKS